MTPDENNLQALRAAADSETGLGRTAAGFSTSQLKPGTYIHYRTVSALVKRGMLEYAGRGIAKITDLGRRELARLEGASR